jgi:polyhydroxyalkanoate synthase
VLAAVDDHIVPWVSGYKTAQLLGGHNRFVLSTSGHIAGIVNPPSPKAKHWTNDVLPADPLAWRENATLQSGTWWEDWATWIAKRGGPKVAARQKLGSAEYPPLEAAPGRYVRDRA